MQNRTLVRTILDIIFDNAIAKTIASVVNFCKEQQYYHNHELKFLKNVPINKLDFQQTPDRFLFKVNK